VFGTGHVSAKSFARIRNDGHSVHAAHESNVPKDCRFIYTDCQICGSCHIYLVGSAVLVGHNPVC
jgi:hypothetical protein